MADRGQTRPLPPWDQRFTRITEPCFHGCQRRCRCWIVLVAVLLHAALHSPPACLFGQTAEPEQAAGASVVELFCFTEPPEPIGDPLAWNPLTHGFAVVIGEGQVLANRHLLADPESSHYFILHPDNHQLVPAQPLALDAWSDLAVLSVPRPGLAAVMLAREDEPLQPNQQVRVIPGDGGAVTVDGLLRPSAGTIDANPASRFDSLAFDSLYQYGGLVRLAGTSAGHHSGCGVFDDQNRLVAVTTGLVPAADEDRPDIVAIALNARLQRVIDVLQSGQLPDYGFLGVRPRDLSEQQRQGVPHGVQVVDVITNSPADVAGFRFTDVITEVDGEPVRDVNDYQRIVGSLLADSRIRIRGRRGLLQEEDPIELDVEVQLSKRRLETRRSSWSQQSVPGWRGLAVEYPFAVPGFELLVQSFQPAGCVVTTHVEPDSPAWRAGLRPRTVITQVDGQIVRSPAGFNRRANEAANPVVRLTIVDADSGEAATIAVPAR
jgi:S1-C subfamily serine protease